ncbi:hypothetical protein LSH36_390g01066 [Paralvinella palmiformis]|uniref:Uncharacterized protein n=1 Tax=Paralvinella palmiformis TaxID=53620 RepID=A0AAD9JE98_9ANNE|nr:hypothetical protein LSH36_390g01066 [Paralvinella palmiformis]
MPSDRFRRATSSFKWIGSRRTDKTSHFQMANKSVFGSGVSPRAGNWPVVVSYRALSPAQLLPLFMIGPAVGRLGCPGLTPSNWPCKHRTTDVTGRHLQRGRFLLPGGSFDKAPGYSTDEALIRIR